MHEKLYLDLMSAEHSLKDLLVIRRPCCKVRELGTNDAEIERSELTD